MLYRKLFLMAISWILFHSQVSLRGSTESLVTSWFALPSVKIQRNQIASNKGTAIRSFFSDDNDYQNREITPDKSPALELAFGDTGDQTFLEKGTIKHSIKELSS